VYYTISYLQKVAANIEAIKGDSLFVCKNMFFNRFNIWLRAIC